MAKTPEELVRNINRRLARAISGFSASYSLDVPDLVITGDDKLDLPDIQSVVQAAAMKAARDLRNQLRDKMRNDGLVDTGRLMNSGRVEVRGGSVEVSYDAPYAGITHFGGYINAYGDTSRRVYLPPRPWVEEVMRGDTGWNFESYIREAINEAYG